MSGFGGWIENFSSNWNENFHLPESYNRFFFAMIFSIYRDVSKRKTTSALIAMCSRWLLHRVSYAKNTSNLFPWSYGLTTSDFVGLIWDYAVTLIREQTNFRKIKKEKEWKEKCSKVLRALGSCLRLQNCSVITNAQILPCISMCTQALLSRNAQKQIIMGN